MILSVITIGYSFYGYTEEMLIPKVLGVVSEGHSAVRRLDRALPVGHRWRGDVGL